MSEPFLIKFKCKTTGKVYQEVPEPAYGLDPCSACAFSDYLDITADDHCLAADCYRKKSIFVEVEK